MARSTTRQRPGAARRRPAAPARRSSLRLRMAAAAIVAVVAVGALILWSRPDDDDPDSVDYAGIPSSGTVRGDPAAPVRIVEYADYQCPFCGQFSREVEPRIIDDFVRSGQVSYELRILPFLGGSDLEQPGNESVQAAEAAYCAMDQGAFWPYSDALFRNQRGENAGAFADDQLRRIAGDIGLDTTAFSACLDANQHHQTALDGYAEAQRAGIRVTPTLLIDGQEVAYTTRGYDLLRRQIEAAIAGRPIPT